MRASDYLNWLLVPLEKKNGERCRNKSNPQRWLGSRIWSSTLFSGWCSLSRCRMFSPGRDEQLGDADRSDLRQGYQEPLLAPLSSPQETPGTAVY